MEKTKMTKRDVLTEIINIMKTGESAIDPEVVVAYCENEIELLDKKAAKAKERAATKAKEGDALLATVEAVLTDEPQIIADITAKIDDPDVTISKVTNRLTNLVNAGKAVKEEVSVTSPTGGKRKVKAYRLAD